MRDGLGERLREIDVPQATEAREGAVAEARAEIAGRGEPAPARGAGRRRALALAAAALLALAVLLTPPGRSASAWVGELVGIGEVGGEPTKQERRVGREGTAVVIDNGTAPDGSRYEWVAFRCDIGGSKGGNGDAIGTAMEWPDEKGPGGGAFCEGLEGRPPLDDATLTGHGVQIVPSQFKGVREPDLVISGMTGPPVHDVKVLYQEPDGDARELPVDFARVEGKLGELAHRPEPMGTFTAFLGGDVAARDEVEQRLDLRALLDTGTLKLGPIARRERELAHAALQRCERFQPDPSDLPKDPDDRKAIERALGPITECHERELPPSPFVYVMYDEDGREIARETEPLITSMVIRAGDVEPFGREQPGDERAEWTEVFGFPERLARVGSGRSPEGTLFEVLAGTSRSFRRGCVNVWWPYVRAYTGSALTCNGFPPEGVYEDRRVDDVAARPMGFLSWAPEATAHNLLQGFARPFVSRVRVVYETPSGARRDARVRLIRVGAERAERVGADGPAGFWLAFLPRSAGRRPLVEVIAYDEKGRIRSRIDYRA